MRISIATVRESLCELLRISEGRFLLEMPSGRGTHRCGRAYLGPCRKQHGNRAPETGNDFVPATIVLMTRPQACHIFPLLYEYNSSANGLQQQGRTRQAADRKTEPPPAIFISRRRRLSSMTYDSRRFVSVLVGTDDLTPGPGDQGFHYFRTDAFLDVPDRAVA